MTESPFKRLQAYVGRPYVRGTYTCAHLAADVQLDLFKRQVAIPAVHPLGSAGQRREIHALRGELARKVAVPHTGCGALFYECTSGGELWHIGTAGLDRFGDVWVLHNSEKLGSAHFHRLHDLQRWGLILEGWYEWK